MTIVFMDGFDHYESADILKKWTGWYNTTPTVGSNYVSPAWACPPGGQGFRNGGGQYLYKNLGVAIATGVVGFNFYTATPASYTIFTASDSGAYNQEQWSLRVDGTMRLLFSRNGTTLATSTNVLSQNTWYHFEVKVTTHNTTGQYEVRVNGSSTGWIPQSAANQNTRAQTNNSFSGVNITGGDMSVRYDDFYVLNCASSPNNDFLGPQKILTLLPNAPGNYSQWTPNYMANFQNVNETVGNGDATFNQSSTPNQIDTFVMDKISSGSSIAGVQHALMARQDTGSGRTICALQRSGSSDYVGDTLALTNGYVFLLDQQDVDPATSAAFTAANLNAAEFGYKLLS